MNILFQSIMKLKALEKGLFLFITALNLQKEKGVRVFFRAPFLHALPCKISCAIRQRIVANFMLAFFTDFGIMKIRRTKSIETYGFWKEISKKGIFYERNQYRKRQTGILG